MEKGRDDGRAEDDAERRPGELLVQLGYLADGEFKIGLNRGEIDTLGIGTRREEAAVMVRHATGYARSWLTLRKGFTAAAGGCRACWA